jgi:hypothetical protein
MKMIASRAGLSMVIESADLSKRPKIIGPLWESFSPFSVDEWLVIMGVEPMNLWPEIDFALAISKDPLFQTEWIEPIFGAPPPGVTY